jgi:hypothetical protein
MLLGFGFSILPVIAQIVSIRETDTRLEMAPVCPFKSDTIHTFLVPDASGFRDGKNTLPAGSTLPQKRKNLRGRTRFNY